MNEESSNEKLDRIIKRIVDDAAASESTIEVAAASPAVWWGVQRHIREVQPEIRAPWPPIAKVWRSIALGLPAAAAAAILVFIYWWPQMAPPVSELAATTLFDEASPVPSTRGDVVISGSSIEPQTLPKIARPAKFSVIRSKPKAAATTVRTKTPTPLHEEIRSDFIALSYARDPESGQIIRVKVPSSMLVTLGLVASVEKPAALVDAEVLVGDDGLSRAIRFIR